MPNVRKLTPEEVRDIEGRIKGQRKLVEEEYDAILQEYSIGEYGEAELAPEEKRITVRNRLRAAAHRRDVGLEFRRTRGNTLRFKVVPRNEEVDDSIDDGMSEPTIVPDGTSKKRGRQKKTVA